MSDPNRPQQQAGELAAHPQEQGSEPSALPIAPEQITEAIGRMPPATREIFEMLAVSTMASPHHPLIDKFKDEHVKQFLDNDRIETANDYAIRSSNRWFHLIYVVIVLISLGLLIWFLLPEHEDMLSDFLKILLAFAGGVTSGFGLKAQLDKKKA